MQNSPPPPKKKKLHKAPMLSVLWRESGISLGLTAIFILGTICITIVTAIGVRDQLRLGGGGAEVFCPNIFPGAPSLKTRSAGGGGGGGGARAPFFFYRVQNLFHISTAEDYVIHVYSERLERKKKGLLPENQVVWPDYYLFVARKLSAFARISLFFARMWPLEKF